MSLADDILGLFAADYIKLTELDGWRLYSMRLVAALATVLLGSACKADEQDLTYLVDIVLYGTADEVEESLEGLDVNSVSDFFVGESTHLIHFASGSRFKPSVLTTLVKFGLDIEVVDHRNRTALGVAIESNHPEAVQILLNAGANYSETDALYGLSALAYCKLQPEIRAYQSDSCRVILEHGGFISQSGN